MSALAKFFVYSVANEFGKLVFAAFNNENGRFGGAIGLPQVPIEHQVCHYH